MVRSGAVITLPAACTNYVYLVQCAGGESYRATNGVLYEHGYGVEITHGDLDQHNSLAKRRKKQTKKRGEGWYEANSPSLARLEINEGHLCHWLAWC